VRDRLLLLGEEPGRALLLDRDEEREVAAVGVRQVRRVGQEPFERGRGEPLGDRVEALDDAVVLARRALDRVQVRTPRRLLRRDDVAGAVLLVELVQVAFSFELGQLELRDVVVSAGVGRGENTLAFRDLMHPVHEASTDRRWRFAHVTDPRSLDGPRSPCAVPQALSASARRARAGRPCDQPNGSPGQSVRCATEHVGASVAELVDAPGFQPGGIHAS
jgi:hypothetical protein